MTPTTVPGAPWWANVGLVVLAVVAAAVTTWWTTRGTRRRVEETQADVGKVLHQVANSHEVDLRADLDGKFARLEVVVGRLADGQEAIREDVGGLHSEMRDVRKDVKGVRDDARRDRRELAEQRDRLDKHLEEVPQIVADAVTKAEADHVRSCPLRHDPST